MLFGTLQLNTITVSGFRIVFSRPCTPLQLEWISSRLLPNVCSFPLELASSRLSSLSFTPVTCHVVTSTGVAVSSTLSLTMSFFDTSLEIGSSGMLVVSPPAWLLHDIFTGISSSLVITLIFSFPADIITSSDVWTFTLSNSPQRSCCQSRSTTSLLFIANSLGTNTVNRCE